MTGEACHVMMKHRRGTPPLHLASQVSTRSYFKQACVCGVVGGPVGEKDPSSSFPFLPGGARGGVDQIAAVLPPRSVAGANDVNRETLLYKKKKGGPTQGTDRMDATTSTSAQPRTRHPSSAKRSMDAVQVVQGDHTNGYSKTTRMQVLVGSTHMHDTLLMTCGTVGRYSS